MTNHETTVTLSERELQVLQMVATGASNQQIARQLVISVNTVKVHLRNIFEKLEVQSRTEATLRAIQEGLIDVSEDNAETESTTLTRRTFLLVNKQPALSQWQQVYLTFAFLLTLAIMITPLSFKNEVPGNDLTYEMPVILIENGIYGETVLPSVPPQPNTKNHWSFQAPMPTHRAGLGLVAFEGKIFAIGGVKSKNLTTRLVEIFDPTTPDSPWVEGEPKPTATTDIKVAVLNDKIYVPGGCDYNREAIANLEIYDPQKDEWEQGQALPEPRCAYGLVALEDKLYLFGGWNGRTFEDTVFVYSGSENEWKVMESVMSEAKGYVGAAVVDGTIYVAGGYDGQAEFDQTYVFVPETGEWLEKSPMKEKRGGLALASASNQLYAIGGGWERPVTTSEKYNPETDTWTTFEAPFADQWRNAGLVAIDTTLYAVGGWNGTEEKYMDSMVSYQVVFQLFIPITIGQ